jgi:MoaA/NifB/PqqE/SkfB family radical SAM enzyme
MIMQLSPICLELHPTLICNLKCTYCSQRIFEQYSTMNEIASGLNIPINNISYSNHMSDLSVCEFLNYEHISYGRFLEIIREALNLGIKEFRISGGGEPLCRPDITIALIEELHKGRAYIELVTNGTLLEKYFDVIFENRLDTLSLSIDCASPNILDLRRGKKGLFSLLSSIVDKINTIKRHRNLIFPKLQIYSVLDKESLQYVSGLLKFAEVNNFDNINFILRKDNEILSLLELESLISFGEKSHVNTNIKDICTIVKGKVQFPLVQCHYPFDNLVIHANGLATPCCSMKWGLGEFVQNKSLEEIWEGNLFKKFRENIKNQLSSDYCSSCKEIQ